MRPSSPIFQFCFGCMSFSLLISIIVYTRLEEIDDDDIVASTTQMNLRLKTGFKGKGKRNHKLERNDMVRQIQEFAQYQQEAQQQRQKTQNWSAREIFEQSHPPQDSHRWHQVVASLRTDIVSEPIDGYDIYNCPLDPPAKYPYAWNLMQVLGNWNASDMELPSKIYQGLCLFDWETEQDKARHYRDKNLPFVVQNFPDTMMAAERWNTPGYMEAMLDKKTSSNPQQQEQDTEATLFSKWLTRAKKVLNAPLEDTTSERWYFRQSAMLKGDSAYLYEELPLFDPSKGQSFAMVDPAHHRGINCRFGMKGIVSEAHYDAQNNFIALMGGQRRYILAHPDQCQNMQLNPKGHPNARHSMIDWSTAHNLLGKSSFPITEAQVNEVVLQAGDLLYLPTYYFHFIVSLNTNYQCNSRSGVSLEHSQHILDCGFDAAKEL